MNLRQVILAGGSGSRLWPMSRTHYPKQLLALVDDHSLLQNTVNRLRTIDSDFPDIQPGAPIIVCNEEHRFLVAEQLRSSGTKVSHLILEPIGRNTAPALTIAAHAAQQDGEDPILIVVPSDHVIADEAAFHRAVATAAQLATQGKLVTFGIKPTHAETGYGYIRKGEAIETGAGDDAQACTIGAFVEKPDETTARQYVDSGDYLWNSGMFVMQASTWLSAIDQLAPDIGSACEKAYTNGAEDGDFYRMDSDAFTACPSDSIDYAVMEKVGTEQPTAMVMLDAGWSDIGAWSALWDMKERDSDGNVCEGDVHTIDTQNSLIMSAHRLVATVGLRDMVVVETADAVMVAHKDAAQDVKGIVDWLKQSGRDESMYHRCVYRPWGNYESVDSGDRFQVKRITVSPGAQLSLQKHHHRAEHWIVVTGTARVTRGEDVFLLTENESTYIPLGTVHRLENPGTLPLEIIEVQSGSYLGEDDIVRYEDIYNRADS